MRFCVRIRSLEVLWKDRAAHPGQETDLYRDQAASSRFKLTEKWRAVLEVLRESGWP